jgi:hypothetical protein
MLHSGSRRIGLVLAEHHMAIAKRLAHNAELPDPDLAVFLAGTPEMAAYRRDLEWAQRYAARNRAVMLRLVRQALVATLGRVVKVQRTVHCHHNYVAEETHFGEQVLVTRKGAIRAGAGEWGIIPGSMGTASYIVEGLGNPDAYASAAHGAGRRMSRNQARRTFTVADLAAQTAGVESRKDAAVVDEIPGAYKSIEEVIAAQQDLGCCPGPAEAGAVRQGLSVLAPAARRRSRGAAGRQPNDKPGGGRAKPPSRTGRREAFEMVSTMKGKKSKTAAASTRAGSARKPERFNRAGQAPCIIPLDGGRHAWVVRHDAPTLQHLPVAGEAFVAALADLAAAGYQARILEELHALGWREVEARLRAAIGSDLHPADRPGTRRAA